MSKKVVLKQMAIVCFFYNNIYLKTNKLKIIWNVAIQFILFTFSIISANKKLRQYFLVLSLQ